MFDRLRARLACWRHGHVPIMTRRFGAPGVDWICYRCFRNLGTTMLDDRDAPTRLAHLERTDRHAIH